MLLRIKRRLCVKKIGKKRALGQYHNRKTAFDFMKVFF